MIPHRRWPLGQWLPPFAIKFCYFFQDLWDKRYKNSQYLVNLASASILTIMGLFYTLVEYIFTSLLIPIILHLWQILLVIRPYLWNSICILLWGASIITCQLLRYAWKHPSKALLKLCHWGYYMLVIIFQDNAYYIILRAIQYQLLFTLAMASLDCLEALTGKVMVKACKYLLYRMSQWGPYSPVEACCLSTLPSGGMLLSQLFPGPMSFAANEHFQGYSSLPVHVIVDMNGRHSYLGASGKLNQKQSSKVEEKKSEPHSFGCHLIYQIKTTFVIFLMLYLYDTYPSIKIGNKMSK